MALPTINEYCHKVDLMVATGELTIEQSIVLTTTYKLSLTGKQVNVRYLMQLTNLGWKQINWLLNGLVQKGAIKKIDKYFYTI
jgi:hypothetical protein